MPSTSFGDERVQRLLRDRRVAVLTTLLADGAPLAMAMWFAADADGITMLSQDRLQKVRNLRRDPRVAVVVESDAGGGSRCVSVRGRAAFVGAGQARPFVEQLLDRYGAGLESRWGGRELPRDRVLFRVIPGKVFFWGQA